VNTASKQFRRRPKGFSVLVFSYSDPPIASDMSAISHVTA
jgi:hypothetical protein